MVFKTQFKKESGTNFIEFDKKGVRISEFFTFQLQSISEGLFSMFAVFRKSIRTGLKRVATGTVPKNIK